MVWLALATAAVLLTAGTVQAQTVVTRSGEHKGFTRLVMRLPNGADWSLTQSGYAATNNIDAPEVVFDTSRVFNLIPRTRLQHLGKTGPGQPPRPQPERGGPGRPPGPAGGAAEALKDALAARGMTVLGVKCDSGNIKVPVITMDPVVIRDRFMKSVQE